MKRRKLKKETPTKERRCLTCNTFSLWGIYTGTCAWNGKDRNRNYCCSEHSTPIAESK